MAHLIRGQLEGKVSGEDEAYGGFYGSAISDGNNKGESGYLMEACLVGGVLVWFKQVTENGKTYWVSAQKDWDLIDVVCLRPTHPNNKHVYAIRKVFKADVDHFLTS